MGNREKIIFENADYIKKANVADFHAEQSGRGTEDEKGLKKELKEDSFGKASMMEILVDRLVGELSRSENYKIINNVLGEEGAAQELADRLWKYSEKLGSKHIIPNNNAYDMFMNLYAPFLGLLHTLDNKIKKFEKIKYNKSDKEEYEELKGKCEKLKNSIENCKKGIIMGYNNLKNYLNLLENNKKFETAELNSKLGYLTGKIDDEQLELLKANKAEYIGKCELELSKN